MYSLIIKLNVIRIDVMQLRNGYIWNVELNIHFPRLLTLKLIVG